MRAFGNTDIGCTRKVNEDDYCILQNENGDWLAAVCDGIGGSAAGEVASHLAVSKLREAFLKAPVFKKDSQVNDWIHDTLNKANDAIYLESMRNRKERGMGTTCVGMIYANNATYIFNVGDSRLYAYYSDGLIQMSENALGVWRVFRIDTNKIDSNYRYILICSDGLHGYVSYEEIQAIIDSSAYNLTDKVNALISRANQSGGYDNCTVILMENERYQDGSND